MRATYTKTIISISLIAALSPQIASANASSSFSCSANLVVSLDNGYSASCDGDFSFTDGILQNDTSISLTAGGLISIGANASLSAPFISLISKDIYLGGTLNAPNGEIKFNSPNSIVIASGAQTNVVGNSIIQDTPKAIVEQNPFYIAPSASLYVKSGNKWGVSRAWGQAEGTLISGNHATSNSGSVILSNNLLTESYVIDAGRGSKTATYLPAQIIQTDSGENITTIITSGVSAGSGIRVNNYDTPKGIGGSLVLLGAPISSAGIAGVEVVPMTFVTPVPEPSTYIMMILGLISLSFMRKTKQH